MKWCQDVGRHVVRAPLLPHRLNPQSLRELAGQHDGMVHGDDSEHVWDVEFPRVEDAALFAREGMIRYSWVANLRDPLVSLYAPCTLAVRASGTSQAFADALEMEG